jgi:two-component system chemotaxis response regulator CheY
MSEAVVIVDDSEMIRNFHSYIIKGLGLHIITAANGADALEKIYSTEYKLAVCITDINMPNMDGYTLIERLREDPNFEDIPIIIISTEDEFRDKERGFAAGANVYIVKPTDPDVLLENISMLLGI